MEQIKELLEEIKEVRNDLVHTNNPHFQSLQNIILKWETKLATKEIEDDRKEITIDNARTRLEQMSVLTHDPITD
jgi:hypothetical protein